MSDEREGTTTGFADRGAPATGPEQAGATAVPDPRTEARPEPAAPSPATGPVEVPPPVPPSGAQRPTAADRSGAVAQPAAADQPAVDRPGPAEPSGGQPGVHPTAPVPARPRPRMPSRDQMTRMGPWAPVAGAAAGLVLGIVVVLLLAPAVSSFEERLSLVFVVLGMTLLGAGGTLLADEVRLLRRGTSAVQARNAGAEAIAGLLNGLTPARLLIVVSAFVLLLSAYVTTRG